eukprot:SAG31_NODE_18040_length_649_cov_0.425455_1_plen_24_part_10
MAKLLVSQRRDLLHPRSDTVVIIN